MIEKNDPYYIVFQSLSKEERIKWINKEINIYYTMLNQLVSISKTYQEKNIKMSSNIIKYGILIFLENLNGLGDTLTEEEKRESLFNETKVYINMLQLLTNNL